jgi:hypothetical protein
MFIVFCVSVHQSKHFGRISSVRKPIERIGGVVCHKGNVVDCSVGIVANDLVNERRRTTGQVSANNLRRCPEVVLDHVFGHANALSHTVAPSFFPHC